MLRLELGLSRMWSSLRGGICVLLVCSCLRHSSESTSCLPTNVCSSRQQTRDEPPHRDEAPGEQALEYRASNAPAGREGVRDCMTYLWFGPDELGRTCIYFGFALSFDVISCRCTLLRRSLMTIASLWTRERVTDRNKLLCVEGSVKLTTAIPITVRATRMECTRSTCISRELYSLRKCISACDHHGL